MCTILGYGLPERETCCILPVNQLSRAYFLTKWKKCNILSLFLQIHIVESTIPRRSSVPLSLQRGKYVISFYFPLFKQSGINYPPTSSVPLSFKKGASFLMLSFNQLSHACPLQEENIPLHSCNLQGLHHPEPRMA